MQVSAIHMVDVQAEHIADLSHHNVDGLGVVASTEKFLVERRAHTCNHAVEEILVIYLPRSQGKKGAKSETSFSPLALTFGNIVTSACTSAILLGRPIFTLLSHSKSPAVTNCLSDSKMQLVRCIIGCTTFH